MLGIPAVVAKVPKIVVVTPPNEKGEVDDAILAAAKIIGITEIYKSAVFKLLQPLHTVLKQFLSVIR